MKFALLSLALLASASAATSKMAIKKKPITLKGVESNVLMVRACKSGAKRVVSRAKRRNEQQELSASAELRVGELLSIRLFRRYRSCRIAVFWAQSPVSTAWLAAPARWSSSRFVEPRAASDSWRSWLGRSLVTADSRLFPRASSADGGRPVLRPSHRWYARPDLPGHLRHGLRQPVDPRGELHQLRLPPHLQG